MGSQRPVTTSNSPTHTQGTPPTASHPEAGTAKAPPKAESKTGMTKMSKEAIQAGVKSALPAIRSCFDAGRKQDPSLAGRVVLLFDIEAQDGQGLVTKGQVAEEETMSPFFEACILKSVADVQFDAPESEGKITVRYPFSFDPGGGFGGAPDGKKEEAP